MSGEAVIAEDETRLMSDEAGVVRLMGDQKPTLDYRIIPPEDRRPRFLEKMNPDATRQSLARSAIGGWILALSIFLLLSLKETAVPWPLFAVMLVISPLVGMVHEWQVPD